MILAIGFRVRSKRGTQFRIWANRNLKEYMVKGFIMDDERLKNPDGRPDYFDEFLYDLSFDDLTKIAASSWDAPSAFCLSLTTNGMACGPVSSTAVIAVDYNPKD